MASPARPTTLTLPIDDLRRGIGRGAPYTARYGPLHATGDTQAAAKADLAAQVRATVEAGHAEPAFARDDDGSLIVAIPDQFGDVAVWRIDDTARLISRGDGPAQAVVDGCPHYTPVPKR